MSADNWTYCPKCSGKFVSEREKAIALVKSRYGKIAADDYEAKLLAAKALPEKSEEPTLREDYQIGIYGSEFQLDYRALCKNPKCGFEVLRPLQEEGHLKSEKLCPACQQLMEWSQWDNGRFRLWCANPTCKDVRPDVSVDTKLGDDVNFAHKIILSRFEKDKQQPKEHNE